AVRVTLTVVGSVVLPVAATIAACSGGRVRSSARPAAPQQWRTTRYGRRRTLGSGPRNRPLRGPVAEVLRWCGCRWRAATARRSCRDCAAGVVRYRSWPPREHGDAGHDERNTGAGCDNRHLSGFGMASGFFLLGPELSVVAVGGYVQLTGRPQAGTELLGELVDAIASLGIHRQGDQLLLVVQRFKVLQLMTNDMDVGIGRVAALALTFVQPDLDGIQRGPAMQDQARRALFLDGLAHLLALRLVQMGSVDYYRIACGED